MFRVFCGADVIYDPRDPDLVLTGLKAELALNETGSFEFTMPVTHPYRGKIELMQKSREIVLEQDGEVLFRGRATQRQGGFYGGVQYRCEGDRAYLNDVTLPPYSTTNQGMSSTVDGLFNWYLSQYNSKVPQNQRFLAGINQGAELDPNNYIMRENSARVAVWPELKEKLLDKLGGYVRVRYENGLRYIDYLAGGDTAAAQRIEFGQNLLDYTRLQDATQFCTRIIPEGAEIKDADGNGTGVKLSIADLPDGPLQQGFEKVGDAIVNVEAERTHGVIEHVISFDDITVARNLLDRGLRHLVNVKVGDTMEITAVDLHMVDTTIESIRLGDYVRATSKPHGFDEYFICTRLTVYPDDPGANKFVLGSEYDTLTGRQSSKIAALNASINKQYEAVKSIDQVAKDAAKKADAAVVASWDEYAVSSSSSDPPRDDWATVTPEWTDGNYIWRRAVTSYGDGTTVEGVPACMTGNAGASGEDATVVLIDSSNGNAFKNNSVSTTLRAIVFHGANRITTIDALKAEYGSTARMEWSWQRLGEGRFGVISADDTRLSESGMALTISPADVDEKTNFAVDLKTD